MGEQLGTVYHLLWNECAYLHVRWDEYVEMFGSDQERFDVMNAVAPGFFKSVQDSLWESILLHLCRFADPAKVAYRKTLSLETLLAIPGTHQVPNIALRVAEAKLKIKFAQDWRNRSIAHNDLERALDKGAKPLAPASRLHVKEALAAIARVLEAIESHFTGSDLIFGGHRARWGGMNLLAELRLVQRLRKEREERLQRGIPTPEDLDWRRWH